MPQSTAALRQKADTLRMLRNPQARLTGDSAKPAALSRPVRARSPYTTSHGQCLALEIREAKLWVLVQQKDGTEGWAPIERILAPGDRREWARRGFG